MSWSYDQNEDTDLDRVRGLIGDTDTTDQLLSDEKIEAELTRTGSVNAAAIACAESLAAKFSRYTDVRFGPSSESRSQAAKAFADLVKQLRRKLSLVATPYAGGISKVDKETREANTDRVEPSFTTDQFDYEGLTVGDQ